jgi:hypothetical protein
MWELVPPDPVKAKELKRFQCTITDRSPIVDRPAGTKRYHEVFEDFSLGIRIIAEGDTREEVGELMRQAERNVRN